VIFLVAGCFALLAGVIAWQSYAAVVERDKFTQERQEWATERRDLNNRIQVPEAAPFLFEAKPEDAEDDLPLPPEFVADAEELEKAQRALAEVGYDEGPAT
jgi:hypothetical protein